MKIKTFAALGLASALAFSACSEEDAPCLLPSLAQVKVGCYRLDVGSGKFVDTFLPKATFVCLDIDSARNRYVDVEKINKFLLILSPLKDSVRWVLQVESNAPDTLTFYYQKELKFLSNACGYTHNYRIGGIRATQYNIDSAVINDPLADTKAEPENAKIYF